MFFQLHMEMDNDAFYVDDVHVPEREVARILRDVADKLDRGACMPLALVDYNGVTTGSAEYVERRSIPVK